MKKHRLTREIQQEQISRKQLSERLVEFGWLSTSPLDLGEDFIVHIYLDGQATGIAFHVQEKSITNLSQRRKAHSVVYPFKAKDLKHWETFSLPVVLVVWDIKLREGRWALVSDVISELNKRRPSWRNNKSKVLVHIPWGNTTDSYGLTRLKQEVGQAVYPLIADDKPLEITAKFSFPDTPEGQEARNAFERHLREGEPVTLKGRIIQELQFSEWWQRWFGEYDPDNVELHLGPTSSRQSLPAGINIVSDGGKAVSLANIELRLIKGGTELIQLTNEDQVYPLLFNVSIRRSETAFSGNLSLRIRDHGHNVQVTLNILEFLQALSLGGKLCLTFASLNNQTLFMNIDPQKDAAPDPHFFDLVRKLCFIQEKTKQFFSVPTEGISARDASAINELYQVLERGSIRITNATISGEFKGPALQIMLDVHRRGQPIHLRLSANESFVELFGKQVPTGPMTRTATGVIEMPAAEFEAAVSRLSLDDFLSVKIVKAEVIEGFSQWSGDFPERHETSSN